MASQILPMCNGAASRARVFQRQGVTLTLPAHSRSGVRDHDGTVIFAMVAADVLSDDWGFSCLLWRPRGDAETLEHCRLAMRRGTAEGFLFYADGAQRDGASGGEQPGALPRHAAEAAPQNYELFSDGGAARSRALMSDASGAQL